MKNVMVMAMMVGLVALTMLVASGPVEARSEARVRPDVRPRVQLAILLDTSNSMDGLIAQAKTELWTIVNKLAKSKRKGLRPRLEVALYEYGNSGLSKRRTGTVLKNQTIRDGLKQFLGLVLCRRALRLTNVSPRCAPSGPCDLAMGGFRVDERRWV